MELYQVESGYRYNSDTLYLYNFIQKCDGKVLDVGCGCGILGLLLKRDFPTCSVTLLDIQPINCQMAEKNAKHNNIEARVKASDFFDFFDEKFDLIVTNPPFYHDGAKKSESVHVSLSRYSSNLPFDRFLKHTKKVLNPHGRVIFCYDAKQILSVFSLLGENKFTPLRVQFVYGKEGKDASLVLVEAKLSSKSLCKILTPIITNDELGFTKQAYGIFQKSNTKSLTCK